MKILFHHKFKVTFHFFSIVGFFIEKITTKLIEQIEEEEKQLTTDSELWDKEWEDEPNDENYIITETEPNGEEHLKCGTLNQLIYWLTRETKQDLKFQKSFLVTYRSFVSPHELFAKLVQR